MAGDKFINPYNFIPFPPKKAPAYADTDKHTGVIRYHITTKTPLFIPNSSSESAFKESTDVAEHKSYDFFSYTKLKVEKKYEGEYHIPVIPGSEIRGVVRNVYETLTDSCMGLLNGEDHPVKRTAEKFSPALLYRDKNGKMILYDAKSVAVGDKAQKDETLQRFKDCKNGTYINGKGYLLKWGMGGRKRRYHVFSKGAGIYECSLTRDEVERKLFPVINSYLDQPALEKINEDAYKEYKHDLEDFLRGNAGEYFPINYSAPAKGILYLSPATITKEVSNHTIGALAGGFAPCIEDFCPACDLFGHIGKNNEMSSGSRIRFTDLYVSEQKEAKEYYLCDKITIQALGAPKIGNVEFYLKKPEGATFWTYDYHIRNGRLDSTKSAELRGRKYYWHHTNVKILKDDPSKLNRTIRPIKDEVTFEGCLYFERISYKQLKQLIWILNSGREGLGLKLGAAKPLGLGSISCTVDEVKERTVMLKNGSIEYIVKDPAISVSEIAYEDAEFSSTVKREFYKMADLKGIPEGMEITYPKERDQKNKVLEEGYRWYVKNHSSVSGKKWAESRADMKILHTLPEISENIEEMGLPYDVKFRNGTGYQNTSYNNTSHSRNTSKKDRKKPKEEFHNRPFIDIKITEDGKIHMEKKGKR